MSRGEIQLGQQDYFCQLVFFRKLKETFILSFIYGSIWIMISKIINNRLINRKK